MTTLVQPLVGETVSIHVVVEPRHIQGGEPECPYRCAVALAIRDAADVSPIVSGAYVAFEVDTAVSSTGLIQILAPSSVLEFVVKYDGINGRNSAEPFEFDLDVPVVALSSCAGDSEPF